MDACNIDEIQNLFIYYSACFSKYFPELGFYCNEREFQIHGIVRRYSDITGVSHDGSYFGSPDKPGGLSIQLCKSEKKEFYIRYSS